eukprot:PLAT2625.1.p1 GENE.PLAT2625.1~~PLAT2625.1.p1  ORF type:complete len:198 (-),score=83.86 PLAT2625.1:52-579(-)
MEGRQSKTVEDAEDYAELTGSSLLYLQLELLRIRDSNADHAASHLGRTLGLITLLRSVPFFASQGKLPLPTDVMAEHGVVIKDVCKEGVTTPELEAAVFAVASAAHGHVQLAKSLVNDSEVPDGTALALLQAVPAEKWLDKLAEVQFDLFQPSLYEPAGLPLQMALTKAAWRAKL